MDVKVHTLLAKMPSNRTHQQNTTAINNKPIDNNVLRTDCEISEIAPKVVAIIGHATLVLHSLCPFLTVILTSRLVNFNQIYIRNYMVHNQYN